MVFLLLLLFIFLKRIEIGIRLHKVEAQVQAEAYELCYQQAKQQRHAFLEKGLKLAWGIIPV